MKQVQKRIKEFCEINRLSNDPQVRMLDIVSEVGEVSKEILKMSDYGAKKPEFREEIRGELGDLLFSLMTLANSLDIDLEEALEIVLKKYEKRLAKGSAGSEND